MQMRHGLLDDQSPIAGLGVLGQLAKHDCHVNQIVEAQSVLPNLEGIYQQRQPGLQALKVAGAQRRPPAAARVAGPASSRAGC